MAVSKRFLERRSNSRNSRNMKNDIAIENLFVLTELWKFPLVTRVHVCSQ